MKFPHRAFTVTGLFLLVSFGAFAASAKDQWLQVRSKNFLLIGNAGERDIRKVATKLEQFRETFRIVFSDTDLSSPIPINVVVFKSDGDYRPFKPKRGDGKIDDRTAGYFQPGEDVNYITLSIGGSDSDTFGTIFHEYVHFILDVQFGKNEVPSWFNEGLAEYYQTFEIKEDQVVKLGLPQNNHLRLLQESKMMPLADLLRITGWQLSGSGHSRSVFYAESWALVHYLIQGGKATALGKFLNLTTENVPPDKAFQESFGMDYAKMESELSKYIGQSTYKYHEMRLGKKLVFDTEMQVTPLTEADSQAYLGDLLYHTHRVDDAEPFLTKALALDANSSMANMSLGMVRLRQRKYDEAKTLLEKAISLDQRNHLAFFRLAYLLSREARDEFGYVAQFPKEIAVKMRALLKKAIEIKPDFTESHELFAFTCLVNNEALDEAVKYLQTALKYQPGNQRYRIRIAEIYLRQKKFEEASAIAEKVAANSDDQNIKGRAQNLVDQIKQFKDITAQNAAAKKAYEASVINAGRNGEAPRFGRRAADGSEPTREELNKQAEESALRSLNRALRPAASGEIRVIGSVQKIACKGATVSYSVKTDDESFTLTTKGFQDLNLTTFVEGTDDMLLGCDTALEKFRQVLTYRPAVKPGPVRGELVAIDFVPDNFRFVDTSEPPVDLSKIDAETPVSVIVVNREATRRTDDVDHAAVQRAAMLADIRQQLRTPQTGEVRAYGTIEGSECTTKGAFFYLNSGGTSIKLSAPADNALMIRSFTPEVENVQIGCGMKAIEVPVVFVYKNFPEKKNKTAGMLVSIEFVPRTFELEN